MRSTAWPDAPAPAWPTPSGQPDGRVLIGSTIQRPTGRTAESIRLLPGGAFDASLDGDGRWQQASSTLSDLAVLPGGGLLVGGGNARPTADQAKVTRLRADGSQEPNFGTAGQQVFPACTSAGPLAVQADGRLLVGLHLNTAPRTDLIRLRPDGAADPGFGRAGLFRLPQPRTAVDDVLLQRDGKIVLGGGEVDTASVLVRLLP